MLKSDSDELKLNKTVIFDSATGDRYIELESYITGTVDSITTDVVLVIDHSGSMWSAVDSSKILTINDLNSQKAVREGYYVAFGDNGKGKIQACLIRYYNNSWQQSAFFGTDGGSIDSTTGFINTTIGSERNWVNITNFGNKTFYKSITGALYDSLDAFMNEIKNAVNCRVAIVTFAGRSTVNKASEETSENSYLGSGIFIDGELTWDSMSPSLPAQKYYDAFENPTTAEGQAILTETINKIDTNYGSTPTALGLLYARRLFIQASASSANRVTILFTDGLPNPESLRNRGPENCTHTVNDTNTECPYHEIISYTDEDGSTKTKICSTYIDQAQALKNNQKSIIYTIGPVAGKADEEVLKSIASEGKAYRSSGDDMQKIFEEIAGVIVESSQELNKDTVLVDVISDYFELPDSVKIENDQIYGIDTYTADCIGTDGEGNYIFDEPISFTEAIIDLDAELNRIAISNFDYKNNVVTYVNGIATGKKLIVKFPIIPSDNIITSDSIATNKETSGIYNYNADGELTIQKQFEIPTISADILFSDIQEGGSYSGIIKLIDHTTMNDTIVIDQNKILVIDLNGYVLKRKDDNSNLLFNISNNGKLIVIDSNPNSSNYGKLTDNIWINTNNDIDLEIKGGIINNGFIVNNGNLIINGGSIAGNKTNNDNKGIITNKGSLSLNNCNIIFNKGIALYNSNGDISIGSESNTNNYNVLIENNVSINGEQIYLDSGNIDMYYGDIVYSHLYKKLNTIFINEGKFNYYNGTIGIPYDTGITINNGTFEDKSGIIENDVEYELHYHSSLIPEGKNKELIYNACIPKSKWVTSPKVNNLYLENTDVTTSSWDDMLPEYNFVGWEHRINNEDNESYNLYAIWEEK